MWNIDHLVKPQPFLIVSFCFNSMSFRKIKKKFKAFNNFLNEDTWESWLVYIVLAFVLVRFVIYPVLGLVFGTSYPIVAVVSGSMEHDGSFDDWWSSKAVLNGKNVLQSEFYSNYEISKSEFLEFPSKNGFNTGDIMILVGADSENIEVGDIIVFRTNRPDPIIHRVIEKNINDNQVSYRTKGDHNLMSYDTAALDESNISDENIIGKAVFRVPWLGYVKIIFFNIISFFIGIFKFLFSK